MASAHSAASIKNDSLNAASLRSAGERVAQRIAMRGHAPLQHYAAQAHPGRATSMRTKLMTLEPCGISAFLSSPAWLPS
jgi:hypothetical protein